MEWLTDPQVWIALVTLTLLEVVLGIDNVIFISILAGKLPTDQQDRARKVGLSLALIMRILLLLSLGWVMSLTRPLFNISNFAVSGRDLILILGGLFLIAKSTHEIHDKLEGQEGHLSARIPPSFSAVIVQILILDVVFSLDSVITAVGMANQIGVMIAAVVIAILFMLAFSGAISDYVHRHPSVKVLALAFLILIGVNLLAEGFHRHISKGYTYFAMAFSLAVEVINQRVRRLSAQPVQLHHAVSEATAKQEQPAV
jgi:predicted tellurium resistance membrane protein TerC